MLDLLKAKPIELTDGDGNTKVFMLSKFPAVQGREIVAKYPTSNLPKIGDYDVSRETMLQLMSYVAAVVHPADGGDEQHIRLATQALVNNHVYDWEMLAKIEMAMMEYNCSFFRDGRSWDFFDGIAQLFIQKITEMWTVSSAPSSMQKSPPTTSSEQSTT